MGHSLWDDAPPYCWDAGVLSFKTLRCGKITLRTGSANRGNRTRFMLFSFRFQRHDQKLGCMRANLFT